MKKKTVRSYLLLAAISAVAVLIISALWMLLLSSNKFSAAEATVLSLFFAIFSAFIIYMLARLFEKRDVRQMTNFLRKNNFEGDDVFALLETLSGKVDTQDKEIKHQLARVEKEKNRLSTIINNMDEGLIILDNDLKVIMLNDSAYSWLGSSVEKDKCPGKPIDEVCVSKEICSCIESADSVNLTLGGRHLQLHVNHVVSNTEQVGRIGLLLDVTERYAIDKIKQEFTANVSHELKTPLTSILGYAELIESEMAKGQDALLFAGRIRRESGRMLTLISDIIKLSRLDEGVDRQNLESVDLYNVALECKDVLDMSADKQGISINVTGCACPIEAFHGEITELIYNLIDNGIRYNREGGSVDVKIEPISPVKSEGAKKAIAKLTVSDTGIGIPEEHLPRVFERFYRVDKSRSKETGGTGLGLAIVKHVAERHNAKIDITSKVDKGTTITVTFF